MVVLGDLNDTKDTKAVLALLGQGPARLVEPRRRSANGAERAAPQPALGSAQRHVDNGIFYGKEDSYQRIDYILLSPGMAREWGKDDSYLPTVPNWGVASDHRPVVAVFQAAER